MCFSLTDEFDARKQIILMPMLLWILYSHAYLSIFVSEPKANCGISKVSLQAMMPDRVRFK